MKTKLLSLLFCVLLCYSPSCSAETTYQVSATDLTQLMQDSAQLSQDNKQLSMNNDASLKDLEMLRSQLAESQKALETVKAQLSKLKQNSLTAQKFSEETLKSLQETQKSLRKLEAKVRSKIKLGVEGSLSYAESAVDADANLRLSWQSDGYDIDVRVNRGTQSISVTRWF